MRLIDADELYNRFWERPWYDNADRDECACADVDNAPTIDAVPVVRCKDCQYCDVYNTVYVFAICRKTGETFIPFGIDIREHFCAYGERKEAAHET